MKFGSFLNIVLIILGGGLLSSPTWARNEAEDFSSPANLETAQGLWDGKDGDSLMSWFDSEVPMKRRWFIASYLAQQDSEFKVEMTISMLAASAEAWGDRGGGKFDLNEGGVRNNLIAMSCYALNQLHLDPPVMESELRDVAGRQAVRKRVRVVHKEAHDTRGSGGKSANSVAISPAEHEHQHAALSQAESEKSKKFGGPFLWVGLVVLGLGIGAAVRSTRAAR